MWPACTCGSRSPTWASFVSLEPGLLSQDTIHHVSPSKEGHVHSPGPCSELRSQDSGREVGYSKGIREPVRGVGQGYCPT